MTSPTPVVNGSPSKPRTKPPAAREAEKPETYHGIPVLEMHVDDAIPTPPVPTRYAVRVHPDLARYLLTFNHPSNRRPRARLIRKYAGDMERGLWRLTPQGPIFSRNGVLHNGQNTLRAVEESGGAVWLVIDFGWPDDVIYVVDRGGARTMADSLHIDEVASASSVASAVTKWWQYQRLVGQRRGLSGYEVPSHEVARDFVSKAPEMWADAATVGRRVHSRLDKAFGDSYWIAAYAILVTAGVSPERAEAFFDEVGEGTGEARSATRELGDWSRRRRAKDVRTGDEREPIELIIRAFNAWRVDRSLGKPKQAGFEWSRVRP